MVVDQPVGDRVEVRGFDGTAPCIAALAGIDVRAPAPLARTRTRVHHLGLGMRMLATFCRESSAGDPLAVLDVLRPQLVVVAFSNDVLWSAPASYESTLRQLIGRVEPYADVLVISPFEQRPPRRHVLDPEHLGAEVQPMEHGDHHRRLARRFRIEAERIAAKRDVAVAEAMHALFEVVTQQTLTQLVFRARRGVRHS